MRVVWLALGVALFTTLLTVIFLGFVLSIVALGLGY